MYTAKTTVLWAEEGKPLEEIKPGTALPDNMPQEEIDRLVELGAAEQVDEKALAEKEAERQALQERLAAEAEAAELARKEAEDAALLKQLEDEEAAEKARKAAEAADDGL